MEEFGTNVMQSGFLMLIIGIALTWLDKGLQKESPESAFPDWAIIISVLIFGSGAVFSLVGGFISIWA